MGETHTSFFVEVGHGLPDGAYVKVVREDPRHPGRLYAGTSRGVHVSFDDGEHWQSLQLNLPTTGVNDLLVHEDDLVIATQGHHRFVWNLRYTPPPTLKSYYSIAATPGRPTSILPEGAFVLPGNYTVKFTAGGKTITRALEVTLDPRVDLTRENLASLLDFQQQVTSVLKGVVALQDEIDASNEEAKASPIAGTPGKVAEALTRLAIDLEHSDAPPTSSQRQLLDYEKTRFDQAENEWKGIAVGAN